MFQFTSTKRYFIAFLLCFFTFQAQAQDQTKSKTTQLSYLQDFYAYQEQEYFVVELEFDNPHSFEETSLEYINSTVQVNVPQGFLKKPFSKKIKNHKVKNVYVYQVDSSVLRVRVIYKEGIKAKDFEGKVNLSYNSHRIRIAIQQGASPDPVFAYGGDVENKASVEQPTTGSDTPSQKTPEVPQTKDVVTKASLEENNTELKTKVSEKKVADKEIPVVAKNKKRIVAAQKTKTPSLQSASVQSESYLLKSFLFLSLLFTSFLGFFIWYRKKKKSSPSSAHFQADIKVLANHYLGPKKNLTVIQVGDEIILLGVTDHNISYLKKLSSQHKDKEKISDDEVSPHRYTEIQFNEEVS